MYNLRFARMPRNSLLGRIKAASRFMAAGCSGQTTMTDKYVVLGMAAYQGVTVCVFVTTLSLELNRGLEPRAS